MSEKRGGDTDDEKRMRNIPREGIGTRQASRGNHSAGLAQLLRCEASGGDQEVRSARPEGGCQVCDQVTLDQAGGVP